MIYIHWIVLVAYTVIAIVAMITVLLEHRQPAKTIARPHHHKFEDVAEQVHLRANRLCWVIQARIGIFYEIEFTIDVATPNHIFLHRSRGRE